MEEEIGARWAIDALHIPEISEPATKNDFLKIDQAAADYDDKRMCALCKQVCVFSAIACECNSSDVACIRHYHMLCKCAKNPPGPPPSSGVDSNGENKAVKKKSVNRRFLISWASITDLNRLKEESKIILTESDS